MELQEAKKYLKVNEEEKKSIQRYMGFAHARLNMLADFNPYDFKKITYKGFEVANSVEDIKQDIRDFVNIYSAMYKEKRDISYEKLIRGTTNDEAGKIYEGYNYDRILSTTNKEEIAKMFCEYGNSALIRIKTQGEVPVLDANDFLEKNSRDESEIIIAPFCKVQKKERTSNYNGYAYYDVIISSPELKEIPQDKIDELKRDVLEQFPDFIKEVKSLKRDKPVYDEQEIRLDKFRKKIQELVKGLCKQKEIEIDKAHETIQKNINELLKKREIERQEEAKRKEQLEQEKIRQSRIAELQKMSADGVQQTGELDSFINEEFGKLRKAELGYVNIAQKLGINFQEMLPILDRDILGVTHKIGKVNADVQDLEYNENDELYNKQRDMRAMIDGILFGKEISKDVLNLVEEYNKESIIEIKRNLYEKVQAIIIGEKTRELEEQKYAIQNEKVTFLERIFGKENLKSEQMRFIDLQMQYIKEQGIQEKQEYSIREILADIRAFSITHKDNIQVAYINDLEDTIWSIFSGFTEQEIEQMAISKISQDSNLPAIPEKVGLFNIGKAREQLINQNDLIERDLVMQNGTNKTWQVTSNRQNVISKLRNTLQIMQNAIKDKQEINEQIEHNETKGDTAQLY